MFKPTEIAHTRDTPVTDPSSPGESPSGTGVIDRAASLDRSISRIAGHVPWRLILIVVGLVFVVGEVAFAVMASTERGCSFCHDPRSAHVSNSETAHAEVECLSCHRTEGFRGDLDLHFRAISNLYTWLTPWTPTDPSRAVVEDAPCLRCHEAVKDGLTLTEGIRMSHAEPIAAGMTCLPCHRTALHSQVMPSFDADHGTCSECHDGDQAATDCVECHSNDPPRDKASLTGTEAITHGDDWQTSHFMGNMNSCTMCHARTFCKQCHGVDLPHQRVAFPYLHGQQALEAGYQACTACHGESFCDSCHIVDMPHRESYLAGHRTDAEEFGEDVCSRCHVPDDCLQCHLRHVHPGLPPELREELSRSGS